MCSQVCKFCEERIFVKMWFVFSEKDSCEQSGVNTIESLQGFHPFIVGAMLVRLSYLDAKNQSILKICHFKIDQKNLSKMQNWLVRPCDQFQSLSDSLPSFVEFPSKILKSWKF